MFFKRLGVVTKNAEAPKVAEARNASIITDDLSLHELDRSCIQSCFTMEHHGAFYFTTGKKSLTPLTSGPQFGVCKVRNGKNGDLQIEYVHDLNEVSLDVLRQLDRFSKKLIYFSIKFYTFCDRLWILLKDKELEEPDGVSFNILERYERPQKEFISGFPHLEKTAITYQRKAFKEFEGNSPQPLLDPLITYIAEGEYYVLYGGMIPMKYVPQQTIDNLLDFFMETFVVHRVPREQIRKYFEECYYLSDAVWNYHTIQERWELVLPDTNLYQLCSTGRSPSRPMGTLMKAFHHCARKKIYYLCKNFSETWGPLYEYDYQINLFRQVGIGYTFTKKQGVSDGVIDFSNDTLLLLVEDTSEIKCNILVFCFQTHKSILIELQQNSKTHLLFNQIGLLDEYKKLVFIHPAVLDWRETIAYVDWGKIKKTTLNPFLDKHRKKIGEGNSK